MRPFGRDMHIEDHLEEPLWNISDIADIVQQTWTSSFHWCRFGCCGHSTGRCLRIPRHMQNCLTVERQTVFIKKNSDEQSSDLEIINLEKLVSKVDNEVKPELWEPRENPICFF